MIKISNWYKENLLIFSLILTLLSSCIPMPKTYVKTLSINPEYITEVAYFEPISTLSIVEQGNIGVLNDSLSQLSNFRIDSILTVNASEFRLNKKIVITDELYGTAIADINKLDLNLGYTYELDAVKIPYSIRRTMLENDTRFAVLIINNGHERTKKNANREALKNIIDNKITLKYYSRLSVFLFDALEDRVFLYAYSEDINRTPVNPKRISLTITRHFHKKLDIKKGCSFFDKKLSHSISRYGTT